MASPETRLTYPSPVQAHVVPTLLKTKQNPRIVGFILVVCAYIVENLGFLRRFLWHNAGFGILRTIREHIEHAEPRYDPTVYAPAEISSHGLQQEVTEAATGDNSSSAAHRGYSAAQYRALFLSGELTPLDLAKAILPLIRRDTTPPGEYSTAWVEVNADIVLKAAAESTQRYKERKSLGPLDGVPTAVKDSYDMRGYKTTLGSPVDIAERDHDGQVADSWCVTKLKEAGAIILGKTNMHELGIDTSGLNITYGTPRNPYNDRYYTGGSSSGSAHAVAAGLIPFALGTDGGGSVRIPASFCSTFGLKTTHGRLSYLPGKNHSNTCEVNGILAADMQTLASAYLVVSQQPVDSCFHIASPSLFSQGEGRRKVIGIPESWFQRSDPAVQKLCRSMIQNLVERKGYSVVPIEMPFVAEGQIAHAITILTDASTGIADNGHLFSPANRILAALGRTTPATDYLLAQKLRRVLMQHLAHLWKQHPGMVIVTPTTACPGWPIRSLSELQYGVSDGNQTLQTMEYVWMANFCGVPGLSMPAGYVVPEGAVGQGEVAGLDTVGKVPVGMMGMAEWTRESDLVRLGSDAQEVGNERWVRPPIWVDTVALTRKGK